MLAEGTKESHDKAENCQFVKDFLRGRIKRELFKVGFKKSSPTSNVPSVAKCKVQIFEDFFEDFHLNSSKS